MKVLFAFIILLLKYKSSIAFKKSLLNYNNDYNLKFGKIFK